VSKAAQAAAQSDQGAVAPVATDPVADLTADLIGLFSGLDVDTTEAIVRRRDPRKYRERIAAEDSLVVRLNRTEGLRWLDAARDTYNAANRQLRELGYKDAGEYMVMIALAREVTLAIHAAHVATPAEYDLLTAPVRPHLPSLERK